MYAHGFGMPNYISKTMMYIHGLGAKVNFQGLFYTCTKEHVDKVITYVYNYIYIAYHQHDYFSIIVLVIGSRNVI